MFGPQLAEDSMKKTSARLAGLVVLLMTLALTLCAQQNDIPDKAQAAYEKKSFTEAGPLFLLAAQSDPRNASVHLYNAACCFALSGHKDIAFYTLDAAIAKGWRDKTHTEQDEDLVSLRGDQRWFDMLATIAVGGLEENLNAVINDLNNIGAYSYQYFIRPKVIQGGQGSYAGVTIPEKLMNNANASYEILAANDSLARYKGTSRNGYGTVEVSLDRSGRLGAWKYTGPFARPTPRAQSSVSDNRDATINDMNNLAAMAYQYRIRPSSMGGGQGTYTGLVMPEKMKENQNGKYTYIVVSPNEVKVKAVSAKVKGAAIEATIDENGRLTSWTYFGDFQ